MLLELRELTRLWIDAVDRDRVRQLADGEEGASAGIDGEGARLLFGRIVRHERQRAVRGIDLEGGKRRRGALARIEELAVGRDVQIRRPGLAVEAGRQGADALLLLELPFLGIVVEDDDRAVELVEEIDELAARVEHEVARAGLVLTFAAGGSFGESFPVAASKRYWSTTSPPRLVART